MSSPEKLKKKIKVTLKKKLKTFPSPKKISEEDLKISPEITIMPTTTTSSPQKSYNEDFIKILGELKEIQTDLGEHFRATAYSRAEEELIKYGKPIYSVDQIKSLPHIGKTIIEKLNEFVNTGKLNAIEKEKNNPILVLTKIHGVGPKKAQELIDKGITTIDMLRANEKLLNAKQKIGLKYYEDINKRIPRSEIELYKQMLESNFKEIAPPGSSFEIVGSYRRGAENSGDIDIIITNKDNNISAYSKFLDDLIKKNIVIEVLSRGSTKSLTIAKLPDDPTAIPRRLDFLYTPPSEYAFALLYFTGSKYFNVVMRQHALDMGFSLNEHGLSKVIKGKKSEPLTNYFPDEESIFEFLNLVYKDPSERKNAQSIQIIGSESIPQTKKEETKKEETKKEETKKEETKKEETKKEEQIQSSSQEQSTNKGKITIKVKKTTLKKKPIETISNLDLFLKEGISGLKKLSEAELTELFKTANQEYHCKSTPILTDNQYDILREYILEKYPQNKPAQEGHADCLINIEKNKVELPYELWSMDKIKPDTGAIQKWIKKYKGPYTISAKLDGMSALYTTEGDTPKLYTRGNGKIGHDISYFIPYLKLPNESNIAIRGELIISKENFKKYESQKNKSNKEIANARNLVAGIINQKSVDTKKIKDVDFVAYEVINPILKPSDQMFKLQSLNVDTVINETIPVLNNEILSKYLVDWRESYKYEIDGVIVVNDEIYPRPKGNPEYAFAFKMVLSDQRAEAKVLDILWTPTKDGYLAPRVQIEPIKLRGSTINFVTGKNAEFIETNKIGIGAIIELIKAGDVIPEIKSVIVPAPEPLFPSEPYEWNETHKEIILINKEDSNQVLERNIVTFFKALEVEGLGPGNIHRIIEAGYTSVPAILSMTISDFLKVDGFKKKLAEKIYNNIQLQIQKVSLVDLMVGSNIWGRNFGAKRFEIIMKALPDILTAVESNEIKIKKLLKVDGIAQKTASHFVENIPNFIKFLQEANLENKLNSIQTTQEDIEEHELNNKKIVTTGFRFDKQMLEKLSKIMVKIQDTINKQTDILIVKDQDEDSGKVTTAKEKGIPIMNKKEFMDKYKI
jgi:NAD-dependent DNA ligase